LGQPDLILKMPEKWTVPASGADDYRCFVLPTGLKEDKQVAAVEFRAGNTRVVHHILSYVDTQGRGRAKDATEPGAGYTSFGGPGFTPEGEMGGWAPGNLPRFLPDGVARTLPANSDLILQMHYHPSGKPEEDITQVGLYFAKKPATKEYISIPIVAPLGIPAGEANFVTKQTWPVPLSMELLAVTPHMHLLGKKIGMQLTLPDGKKQPLIQIDDWDFNWQDSYYYKTPVKIPAGARISLSATYDNSAQNPRNPNNPPKKVSWGEATTDEMCVGFIHFVAQNENDPFLRLINQFLRAGRRRPEGRGNE
jgi:hypothetical protein